MKNEVNILIVDDDPALRKTLTDILSIKGYHPQAVEHGTAALAALKKKEYAVALIDLKLQDMSGIELLEKIKNQYQLTECILITGHASQTSAIDAINLGAYSYILKPYNMDQLLITIQRAIEKRGSEKSLMESEALFTAAFSSSPNAMTFYTLDPPQFIDVNDSFLQMTGYEKHELVGTIHTKSFLWANELDKKYFTQTVMNKGIIKDFEYAYRKKSGEIGVALVSAQTVEINGKKHILSTSMDITERKKTETRIQRQIRHLRALRDIDSLITGSTDLPQTLHSVAQNVRNELLVDAVLLYAFNPVTQMLEFIVSNGDHFDSIERRNIRLGDGLAGKAALERKTIQIPDLKALDTVNQEFETSLRKMTTYFAIPLIAKGQIKGVMEIFDHKSLNPDPEWLSFMNTLAGQAAIAIDNISLFENLERSNFDLTIAYDATLEGWARALEMRDAETKGHSLSVVDMTLTLSKLMGKESDELVHIRRGALLHDIGKMGIPDAILLKPGPLDQHEWELMKKHPEFAYQMLIEIDFLQPALDIPYCHHERWDGTGYPRGLKGEEIPLPARIFAVIDVYDALVSNRPYRKAFSKEEAIPMMMSESGKHFDPDIIPLFLNIIN